MQLLLPNCTIMALFMQVLYNIVIDGSFHVKSTNLKKSSSMTISDFLHFAVYERHIIQEQNKKNLNLISPLEPEL